MERLTATNLSATAAVYVAQYSALQKALNEVAHVLYLRFRNSW